jgi:hypothetical protein
LVRWSTMIMGCPFGSPEDRIGVAISDAVPAGHHLGNRASCARRLAPLISLEPTVTGHQNSDIRAST